MTSVYYSLSILYNCRRSGQRQSNHYGFLAICGRCFLRKELPITRNASAQPADKLLGTADTPKVRLSFNYEKPVHKNIVHPRRRNEQVYHFSVSDGTAPDELHHFRKPIGVVRNGYAELPEVFVYVRVHIAVHKVADGSGVAELIARAAVAGYEVLFHRMT